MAQFSRKRIPAPVNEPFRHYQPGSVDRQKLKEAVENTLKEVADIPIVIGGKEYRTGEKKQQVMPSDHHHVLCTYYQVTPALIAEAVESSMKAKAKWEAMPFEDRAAIFLKAADLLAHKYRYLANAATMLGQGKTVWQAEIDSAVETIDFWRFNTKFAESIYEMQPSANAPTTWNQMEWRPLEGFVVSVTPFNFTAIGANLPTAPALMGNVVLWKPASTAILSNWLMFKILREAGLPDGVIQFLPGSGAIIGNYLFNHKDFAGLHFTGSTATFNGIWKTAAQNLEIYRSYPRIVGETGGKNFHFVHKSADIDNAVAHTVRAAFEYQGQKCSACSRAYVPDSRWEEYRNKLQEQLKRVKMGQPHDFESFMTAVIDKNAFHDITAYIKQAKADTDKCEIIAGGNFDDSKGYFIEPTVILAKDPHYRTMREEIFGPVLTIYVYPADKYEETLRLCDETAAYALTGSIFAQDREAITIAHQFLRHNAGNFYINDKSTGAVVGQQPFGGARASGTNDKAGFAINLLRWVSARTIKESFLPLTVDGWTYPHQLKDN